MSATDTNISPREKREIDKLFHTYDEAEYELIKKRDEMFPEGCVVRSRINPEFEAVVKDGSLYPNQVLTCHGHMSWHYLEKLHD